MSQHSLTPPPNNTRPGLKSQERKVGVKPGTGQWDTCSLNSAHSSVSTEAASPQVPVPSSPPPRPPPMLTGFTVDTGVAHRAVAEVFGEDVPSLCVHIHQTFGIIVARVWGTRSWKRGDTSDGQHQMERWSEKSWEHSKGQHVTQPQAIHPNESLFFPTTTILDPRETLKGSVCPHTEIDGSSKWLGVSTGTRATHLEETEEAGHGEQVPFSVSLHTRPVKPSGQRQ